MPRSFLSLDNQKIDEGFSKLPCFARHAPATIRFTPNFPRTALRLAGRRWTRAARPDEGLRRTLKVRALRNANQQKSAPPLIRRFAPPSPRLAGRRGSGASSGARQAHKV